MGHEVPPQPDRGLHAIIAIIDKPETAGEDLLKIVKGPDFPTAGIINGTQGASAIAT
jgi:DNA gyrase/topoisomerase IV subunit A